MREAASQARTHARRWAWLCAAALVAVPALSGCVAGQCGEGRLRLGYFANLTHAQPLLGVHTGLYQDTLGGIRLEPVVFKAGPEAYESLLSGSVDAIYVGPSPTLNAFDKTGPDAVRILAGSAKGGAALVTRGEPPIGTAAQAARLRYATPQLGNTQDVALKHWLRELGVDPADMDVRNAGSADILAMFKATQVDAAWVPEPWATRLVREAGGAVRLDEEALWEPTGHRSITTQLVTTRRCIETGREAVVRLLEAHVRATRLLDSGGELAPVLNDALEELTGKRIDEGVLREALPRVAFDVTPDPAALDVLAGWSTDLGFLDRSPDLSRAFDLGPLDEAQARVGAGA